MDLEFSVCPEQKIPSLIQLLDFEFVFAKERQISLGARFPKIFLLKNSMYVARAGDDLAACVVAKPITYETAHTTWLATALGFVYTLPSFRKQGIASKLLRFVAKESHAAGCDFAVLWTRFHNLYGRLGWKLADCSCLGTYSGCGSAGVVKASPVPLDKETIALMQRVRAKYQSGTLREDDDYNVLPLPVDSVYALKAPSGGEGYILFGVRGGTCYVYELIGHPSSFPFLWSQLQAAFDKIHINDHIESPTFRWWRESTTIEWKRQAFAMWLALSERAATIDFETLYVPYLDRI